MADIGSTLREARMRARIDITEVEARTKIRAKYLRAIENEEWDLLPGPVYVKSFLKTYGDYLGLDSRMLIDDFKRRYERPSDGEIRPIASLTRERERAARGPMLPPWAWIVAVIVVIVVVLGIVGKLGSSGNKKPSGVAGMNPKPTTTTTPPAHRRHSRTRAVKPADTAPPVATLQLTASTEPVYVCVTNGGGKVLINGQTFAPGQAIPTEKAPKLLVTLGNNAVSMKVNGKPMTVPASSGPINFALTRNGKRHPLTTTPSCT